MLKKELAYPQTNKVDILTLTGTMGAAGTSVTVAHGLRGGAIVAVLAKVETATNSGVGPNNTATGLEYAIKHDGTNVTLTTTLANSATVAEKPFIVTVLYLTI